MEMSKHEAQGAALPPAVDSTLTAPLLKLVLAAAVVTAPVFLFGEGFEAKYIGRVAVSNGLCALLCLGLLSLVARGRGGAARPVALCQDRAARRGADLLVLAVHTRQHARVQRLHHLSHALATNTKGVSELLPRQAWLAISSRSLFLSVCD